MNQKQICWLAGLLEGEGCFSPLKYTKASGEETYRPRIQIHMNDRDVLERVAEFCGVGNVTGPYGAGRGGNPNAQGFYKWAISGSEAGKIMQAVLPFMGARRASKITEVLLLCT